MPTRLALAALIGITLLAGTALLHSASAEPKEGQQPPQPQAGNDAVRPGDLLILRIPELTGPNTTYVKPVRVDAGGRVTVPYVKEPLTLGMLTLAEAEKAVNEGLRKAGVMETPGTWIDRMERAEAASVKPGPIAPGDVVRVSIVELQGPGLEQVHNLHVSEAGNIGLPYLGQTKVGGMTEIEAEGAVVQAYRGKGLVHDYVPISILRVKLPPGPEPIPHSDKPPVKASS
jgi:protein involved in polysaccharide export with SLBB domain